MVELWAKPHIHFPSYMNVNLKSAFNTVSIFFCPFFFLNRSLEENWIGITSFASKSSYLSPVFANMLGTNREMMEKKPFNFLSYLATEHLQRRSPYSESRWTFNLVATKEWMVATLCNFLFIVRSSLVMSANISTTYVQWWLPGLFYRCWCFVTCWSKELNIIDVAN